MPTIINGNTGVNKVTSASVVPYDNSSSGLSATNVQELGDDSGIQLGTSVALTNQTFVDFAIPAGSKRVTVMLAGVSTNGSSLIQLQVGDSAGLKVSGYVTAGGIINLTGGAGTTPLTTTGAVFVGLTTVAAYIEGTANFTRLMGNKWVYAATGVRLGSSEGTWNSSGVIPELSNTLTTVRLTTVNGTDQFDAGILNVSWEF